MFETDVDLPLAYRKNNPALMHVIRRCPQRKTRTYYSHLYVPLFCIQTAQAWILNKNLLS
jgi:hypothetical protein